MKLLPVLQAEIRSDVNMVMENLKSDVTEVLKEHDKKHVQALATVLTPVYKLSNELRARIDSRVGPPSRPATPHAE